MFGWAHDDTDLRGMPHCRHHGRFTLGCIACWGVIVRSMPVLRHYRTQEPVVPGGRRFPRTYRTGPQRQPGCCKLCGEPISSVKANQCWHPGCAELWKVMCAETVALRWCGEALGGPVCRTCGCAVEPMVPDRTGLPNSVEGNSYPTIELPPGWGWEPSVSKWEAQQRWRDDPELAEWVQLDRMWRRCGDADARWHTLSRKFAHSWILVRDGSIPIPDADHRVPLWRADRQDPRHWVLWSAPNIQLLCPPCHALKTRAEAAERASMKRSAKMRLDTTPVLFEEE